MIMGFFQQQNAQVLQLLNLKLDIKQTIGQDEKLPNEVLFHIKQQF